ncbi:cisplatin damage response ATP-dependent DNA ligase [Alteromonas sediminis]|uniref:DNA ligase (ATP) n=1 Tax=Alteromonas sediminis TaxID=2259342 RepID=A0A3N5YK81_9ALTE|nr:cisplatin damage response ATP-dependent DNA ligase [Alteromonas sediminis]RPJ65241.1 cisplatin damage response ATP-dependent DNA ligase [Alteromonas sediminis]
MDAFSQLLDQLYFTNSTKTKSALIQAYLHATPDPDRGWAIAAIAGTLTFDFFKRNTVKKLILDHVDPTLFALSYDYVGEMSETVAHLWPHSINSDEPLPSLHEIVMQFTHCKKPEVPTLLTRYLSRMYASQRWALLKLGTRGLRVGVSARALKQCLAEYGNVDVSDIERIWHGLTPPYTDLMAWLDGHAPIPDVSDKGKALYSRTGDDISHSFGDLLDSVELNGRLDGELVVMLNSKVAPFNDLQQRLNKKKPSKRLMEMLPVHLIVYDALTLDGNTLTSLPLSERRKQLDAWFEGKRHPRLHLSEKFTVTNKDACVQLREHAITHPHIEGLMLKRLDSVYVNGRPSGQWYKWKRDPYVVDAVIMYAQRGHGKRSSFYSDYTFGTWQGDTLLPIGKAYSGFTDEELKKLDTWVRKNTVGHFGPVKEVKKALVFEIAFDSVHESKRHKSGLALRFPRIHRIRWDKPANEADTLDTVRRLITTR